MWGDYKNKTKLWRLWKWQKDLYFSFFLSFISSFLSFFLLSLFRDLSVCVCLAMVSKSSAAEVHFQSFLFCNWATSQLWNNRKHNNSNELSLLEASFAPLGKSVQHGFYVDWLCSMFDYMCLCFSFSSKLVTIVFLLLFFFDPVYLTKSDFFVYV